MTKDFKKRIFTSIILFIFLFIMYINEKFFTFLIFIASTIALIEFISILSKIFKNQNVKKIISILFFFLYLLFISSFLIYFAVILKLKSLVFILLLICISSDIGGIVIGKIFKGPKLIKKISPNKTISGSVGSFFFAAFMSITLVFLTTNILNFYSLILGLAISLGVQLGDLFFSFLKRKAKIKDTGNLLPGHGGVLDRIDGILFGIPVGFITLILMH